MYITIIKYCVHHVKGVYTLPGENKVRFARAEEIWLLLLRLRMMMMTMITYLPLSRDVINWYKDLSSFVDGVAETGG